MDSSAVAGPSRRTRRPSDRLEGAARDLSWNFSKFMVELTNALDSATTHAHHLPPKSDLAFHRTLDRQFAKNQDEASNRILTIAERLLGKVDRPATGKITKRRKLEDEEDVIDGYKRGVMDVVNSLLEDAASNLDEVSGQRKQAAIKVAPDSVGPFSAARNGSPYEMVIRNADLPKPQIDFEDPVDNSYQRPRTLPPLATKLHAMVPLDFELPPSDIPDTPENEEVIRKDGRQRLHPYYYETKHLPYPTSMFVESAPIEPQPIEDAAPIWVETPDELRRMVGELQQAKEIAVDLEHHDKRSYFGFTCLLQISTREKDWVIDAIKLREELRRDKLGGVMVDPSIIKVFHGADSDMMWLQKDFQIYVVNLFDTHQAAAYLCYPRRSLAALLEEFCHTMTNKAYQMADWRLRPLTPRMLHYAQNDTHYLLYIYDNLRNTLLQASRAPSPVPQSSAESSSNGSTIRQNPQSAMRHVLNRSADVALRSYSREAANPLTGFGTNGWRLAARRSLSTDVVDAQPGWIFRKLHAWRDNVARNEDESPYFIMSQDTLRSLSLRPPPDLSSLQRVLGSKVHPKHHPTIINIIKQTQRHWQKLARKEKRRIAQRLENAEVSSDNDYEESAFVPNDEMDNMDCQDQLSPNEEENDVSMTDSTPQPQRIAMPTSTDIDLWDDLDGSGSASESAPDAPQSGLYGNTLEPSHETGNAGGPSMLVKKQSTLFGNIIGENSSEPQMETAMSQSSFSAVRDAVNAELLPILLPSDAERAHADVQALKEPEMVPFVPADSRKTIPQPTNTGASKLQEDIVIGADADQEMEPDGRLPEAADTRVEVGRKTTKTKRAATAAGQPKVNKKTKKAQIEEDDLPRLPDFDYSTVTNLLDNPESGKTSKKDKKRRRNEGKPPGTGITDTTFGRVAKDPSQPKSGNRSITFS